MHLKRRESVNFVNLLNKKYEQRPEKCTKILYALFSPREKKNSLLVIEITRWA